MSGFVLTNKALEDLREIGRYTEQTWGQEQRNRYLSMLDQCFHELADTPLKGSDCSAILPNYRKHLVGRHLVFYRPMTHDLIEVVRILHQRMDVELHLDDEPPKPPDRP